MPQLNIAMKKLTYILIALTSFVTSSCEKYTDINDPASVKKAKERSEYILLCDVEVRDGTLDYKMRKTLYRKPGTKVPWSVGGLVSAPSLAASGSSDTPDRAVIFYEDFGGRIRPMETKLFYLVPPHNDTSKLNNLITNLKL